MTKELESLATKLEASADYRVLRRFVPPLRYHKGDGSATAKGVVVDVETTGLDTARDKIIEFCGVPFEFEKESGKILEVGEAVTLPRGSGPSHSGRGDAAHRHHRRGRGGKVHRRGGGERDAGRCRAGHRPQRRLRPAVCRPSACGVQGKGVGLLAAGGAVEGVRRQLGGARVPDDEAVRALLRRVTAPTPTAMPCCVCCRSRLPMAGSRCSISSSRPGLRRSGCGR